MEIWDVLGSTNDRARALAESGAPRGTVVLALEQTHGRGRRGSAWASRPGAGVWMSIVLPGDDGGPELPLIVGVACAEVLEEETGLAVTVKWPNDLMIDGRKVGGVLVERFPAGVVVGIGVNVASAPDGSSLEGALTTSPTSLVDEGVGGVGLDAMAGALARGILARLDRSDAVADALDALRVRDALSGRPVWTEELGVGIARGVDEHGMLVLEHEDGSTRTVRSGSVRLVDQS